MLIRDILHPHGNEGKIAIHRLNAMVFINGDGVIDPEKAKKIRRDGPKPDASTICAHLLTATRYQQFKLKQPRAPKAAASKATAPAAPPAATTEAPTTTTEGSEVGALPADNTPPEGGNGGGSLPATPQTGDLETLKSVLAAKKVTELSVGEIEAALKTGKVPKEKAMAWLAQESARKPAKNRRKTLLRLLERHIKKAA